MLYIEHRMVDIDTDETLPYGELDRVLPIEASIRHPFEEERILNEQHLQEDSENLALLF